MARNLVAALRLLLVADERLLEGHDPTVACREAVTGGATSVQVRFKSASSTELLGLVRRLVRELTVPVFVNDRLDIALAAGAAGAHLGADDLAPALARRLAPPGFVIGASVGDDAEVARGEAADYWGIGPLHRSATKTDAGSALGIEGVTRLLARSGSRPCVVIGGVRPDDVGAVMQAGFAGVAVASGILGEDELRAAAKRYVTMDDGR